MEIWGFGNDWSGVIGFSINSLWIDDYSGITGDFQGNQEIFRYSRDNGSKMGREITILIWKNENKYDFLIKQAEKKYGVPMSLIKGIIAKESSFRSNAIRQEPRIRDASRGLMQVLGRTAKALGYTDKPEDLLIPAVSIKYGTKLLNQNIKIAKGNVKNAVSAYNAGFSRKRKGDGKRNKNGRLINQDYVDDVYVYTGYFSGRLTAKEVNTYTRGKKTKKIIPIFFSLPILFLIFKFLT